MAPETWNRTQRITVRRVMVREGTQISQIAGAEWVPPVEEGTDGDH